MIEKEALVLGTLSHRQSVALFYAKRYTIGRKVLNKKDRKDCYEKGVYLSGVD